MYMKQQKAITNEYPQGQTETTSNVNAVGDLQENLEASP